MNPTTPDKDAAAETVEGLPFTAPWLLAPMDGVTEPVFLELVLARNPAEDLGGAFTEFVRVTDHPIPVKRLAARPGVAGSAYVLSAQGVIATLRRVSLMVTSR